MPLLTSVNLHRFPDSVLAEVVEESPDGEISIRSHELVYAEGNGGVLIPRTTLSSTDAMLIDECASADGLSVDLDQIAESAPHGH